MCFKLDCLLLILWTVQNNTDGVMFPEVALVEQYCVNEHSSVFSA